MCVWLFFSCFKKKKKENSSGHGYRICFLLSFPFFPPSSKSLTVFLRIGFSICLLSSPAVFDLFFFCTIRQRYKPLLLCGLFLFFSLLSFSLFTEYLLLCTPFTFDSLRCVIVDVHRWHQVLLVLSYRTLLFVFFFCCCFCLSLFFSLNSVSFYSVDALLRFNRSISGCKLNDSANITELQKRVFFSFTFLLFWSLITLFSLLLLLLVVVCLFFFFSVCVCVSGRVEVSLIRRKWQRSCNVARCCTNARG